MAIPDEKLAWFKFFPTDWLGDSHLQACSASTRGVWANLISHMKRRGVGELAVDLGQLARLGGCTTEEAITFLCEMAREEAADVFTVGPNGTRSPIVCRHGVTPDVASLFIVVSRRLSRECRKRKADAERAAKKRGGEESRESREEVAPVSDPEHDAYAHARDQRSEIRESENTRAPARRPIDALKAALKHRTGVLVPDAQSLLRAAELIDAYAEAAQQPVEQVADRALVALAKISGGWTNPQAVTTQRLVQKWDDVQATMAGTVPAAKEQRQPAPAGPQRREPPRYRDADEVDREEEEARERLASERKRAAGGEP